MIAALVFGTQEGPANDESRTADDELVRVLEVREAVRYGAGSVDESVYGAELSRLQPDEQVLPGVGHSEVESVAVDGSPAESASPAPVEGEGVAEVICSYPWPCDEALAVAWCESRFDPGAISPDGSNLGLFQVNRIHRARVEGDLDRLLDAAPNVAVAYAIWIDNAGLGTVGLQTMNGHRIGETKKHPFRHCVRCGMNAECAETWPEECDGVKDGRRNQYAFNRWYAMNRESRLDGLQAGKVTI